MKTVTKAILLFSMTLLISAGVLQAAEYGAPDTVYAEIAKIDETNWTVTISLANDQDVVGIAVPFHIDAGDVKVIADSAIYKDGRIEHWAFRGFRPDTAIQAATLGMIANLGPTDNTLKPGYGRLATVFISSADGTPIEHMTVDTTTTHPSNVLQVIVDLYAGQENDSTAIPFNDRLTTPVWVVRNAEMK